MLTRASTTCLVVSVALWLAPATRAAEPVVYYSFDELGPVIVDQSGHGYDGTPHGGITLNDEGSSGRCFQFNGTNAYVELNRPVQNDFTITAMIKTSTPGRAGSQAYEGSGLFWSDVVGVANDYVVAVLGTKLSFFNGNPDISVNSQGDVVTGEWVHIAAVRDTRAWAISVYLDGELDNSTLHWNTGPLNSQAILAIGANILDERYYAGLIDEVKIYDVALTAAEIKALVPPKLQAHRPEPADGATGVITLVLQWTAGETAAFHDVYVGTSPDLTAADLQPRPYTPVFYYVPGFTPGVRYFWRVDEIERNGTVHTGDVWSFTAMPLTAYLPRPADGAVDVLLTPTLSWSVGQSAAGHHLYFGVDRQAVEEGAAETDKGPLPLTETSYRIAEALQPDTRCFWRVDETSGDTVRTGPVWSFTTVRPGPTGAIRQWWLNLGAGMAVTDLTASPDFPDNPTGSEFVTRMEGPVGWATNYGGRLYGWLFPPRSGDYIFWLASDNNGELWLSTDQDRANSKRIARVTTWTAPREWTKEANQRSDPIPLEAGQRYYIEALHKQAGGGDNVAVAWEGPGFAREVLGAGGVGPTPYLPQRAYAPFPADGAVDTPQSLTLTWKAGAKALQHAVYLGADANAVAAADTSSSLLKGIVTDAGFDAGDLEWGRTYWWRVDEINAGDAGSPWVGRVWSFSTTDFIPVDDFESYNDAEDTGTRIYETWIDGYTDGLSRSLVGNIKPPYAEQTIVHGGVQSMPMDYDNSSPPFYSQAYREFWSPQPIPPHAPADTVFLLASNVAAAGTPLDWTVNGVTDLSLWVRGWPAPIAAVTETGGKMTVSGAGSDIWNNGDEFTFVYKTLNGDGSLIARVTSNGTGTNTWAKGGVMIRESLAAGSAHATMALTGGGGNGASLQYRTVTDGTSASADATAAIALPYYVKIERSGDIFTASVSADGQSWTTQGTPQYIAMAVPAYIGIAVSSHVAGTYRTFEFDNIQATGAGGFWQTKEIGLPRNSPQPLYVTVEDSAGKKAAVVDPNAAAVNAARWTEWKIPLSDFQGVNLAKVKALYIGVGDPANPTPDGAGRIYIDDIRVTRP